MELTVDLVEITRIPYHELETVYISANLAIIPNGTHVQTKISNGNKSIKFTPHRFSFLVDPISSNSESSLVITIFTHLTNNHKIAISYVTIPINSISIRKICSASLSTTLLASFSISPIVTVSLGFNVNNSSQFKNLSHEKLHHPNEVSEIDYTLYEDAPVIEFDCFGRLKPPNHYIEKCKELVENDPELFLDFILNDSLRKFVLKRAFDHYQINDCLSISNISSGGQQQQQQQSPSQQQQQQPPPQQQPPIVNKQNSSKKTKSSQMKQGHSANCNHQPQPPNQQPSNSRRQNRNDDASIVPPIDTNIINQQPQSFSPTTEINGDSQPVKAHNISVSILKKQYSQQNKNQSSQQYPYVSQQQQQQQQQSNPQIYQNPQVPPISQVSQISHKNESPPKSFVLPVGVDQKKNHRSKNIASIGISKPLIKTKESDTEKSVARGLLPNDKNVMSQQTKKSRPIYVVRMNPSNQNQNQEDARGHSYNDADSQQIYGTNQANFPPPEEVTRKASPSISYQPSGSAPSSANSSGLQTPTGHEHRNQFFPMMKPKPPNPNTVSQHPNGPENGASPRWPRQTPEY